MIIEYLLVGLVCLCVVFLFVVVPIWMLMDTGPSRHANRTASSAYFVSGDDYSDYDDDYGSSSPRYSSSNSDYSSSGGGDFGGGGGD